MLLNFDTDIAFISAPSSKLARTGTTFPPGVNMLSWWMNSLAVCSGLYPTIYVSKMWDSGTNSSTLSFTLNIFVSISPLEDGVVWLISNLMAPPRFPGCLGK